MCSGMEMSEVKLLIYVGSLRKKTVCLRKEHPDFGTTQIEKFLVV
jgi:NADPH-dependent 7-cyano-7-deazaguanine reductase QueF